MQRLESQLADLLGRALQHYRDGKSTEAVCLYQSILEKCPSHPVATQQLGILLVNQGQIAAALPWLRRALEAQPHEPARWLRYIDALLRGQQPQEALAIVAAARRAGVQGEVLDQFEAMAKQILSEPSEEEAQVLALLEAEDYAAAEQMARDQLGKAPTNIRLQHALGLSLLQQQRYEEALPYLQRAAEGLPREANVLNQLALTLSRLKRYPEAQEIYKQVVALLPENPVVYVNIGASLNTAQEFDEALIWLEKGLALEPTNCPLRANKAIALFEKDRVLEAEALVRDLLTEGFRNDVTLVLWGRIRQKEGDPEIALACFEEAEALGGNDALASFCKGNALNDLGRFDEAIAAFEAALVLNPEMAEAWASMAQGRKMTSADQDWWERAQAFLARPDLKPEAAFNLHYAMGKFCDDTKDFDAAFPHYLEANRIKKEVWPDCCYDRSHQKRLVSVLQQRYVPEIFERWRPLANPSARPLFIVGMPRSGTSLTEQILASHPEVFGAGELLFWPRLAERHQSVVLEAAFDEPWLKMAARECLDHLASKSPEVVRVVDKMPGNFLYVGLIHTVFPNARILHTMRNPVDNGLSVYFQNFNKGHSYANDLEDIAHYYQQYHRLMAHWRAVIPADRFLDLPYEQLLEDQEGSSRRIMNFIGLKFDERMLEFYKTERKVGTASNWQARQPIYKTSKERWRNYEKHVQALLPLIPLYESALSEIEQKE